MRTETITNVPEPMVSQIVVGFDRDGATQIEKKQQPDGNWTVIAVFAEQKERAARELHETRKR